MCRDTIIILLFRRPMARPAGSSRAWASHMKLFCGPGLDIIVAGRAGPGPHHSICVPGPGLHNCCGPGPGLGLKSYLRAGPGPRFQARAGP